MGKTQLSERQTKIWNYIHKFVDEHGYPPSVRDIQEGVQPRVSSTSVVDYNLKALEERGFIHRGRGKARCIELIDPSNNGHRGNIMQIPLAPTPIAAGSPIPVLEAVTAGAAFENLDIPAVLIGRHAAHPENLYALRVKGQSMIDALISDGDIVIIRSQETAEVGQTVVAWLRNEQETTLKKYYPEGPQVRLQPANESMAPIYTSADNLEIKGRLVGVMRQVD